MIGEANTISDVKQKILKKVYLNTIGTHGSRRNTTAPLLLSFLDPDKCYQSLFHFPLPYNKGLTKESRVWRSCLLISVCGYQDNLHCLHGYTVWHTKKGTFHVQENVEKI